MAGMAGGKRTNRGIKVNKVVRNVIGVSVVAALALTVGCSGDGADATPANATPAAATVATTVEPNPDASAASVGSSESPAGAKPIAIKVYKTPQCGCCRAWVDHLAKN